MAGRYAAGTEVSSERTRLEIERTLQRYGATSFVYASAQDRAVIMFELEHRRIRFTLPLPDRSAPEFRLTSQGRPRQPGPQQEAYEQAIRQRWRALGLVIKAKLEAVECGISTVEEEFLAHIVLPDGRSCGDWIRPKVREAYLTGTMPPLLALASGE